MIQTLFLTTDEGAGALLRVIATLCKGRMTLRHLSMTPGQVPGTAEITLSLEGDETRAQRLTHQLRRQLPVIQAVMSSADSHLFSVTRSA